MRAGGLRRRGVRVVAAEGPAGTGGLYVRGLMLDGRRKSMQPMAERLGVDHQRLQQFVTSSTVGGGAGPAPVGALAWTRSRPEAWVIDDTGFVKDGTASPCVARQYSGTLGKVGNCQIGVSVHAATDAASCPLDWRLFVPETWDDALRRTPRRRGRDRRPGVSGPDPGHGAAPAEVAAGAGDDRRARRLGTHRRRWWSPTPATATTPRSGRADRPRASPTSSRSRPPPAPTRPTRCPRRRAYDRPRAAPRDPRYRQDPLHPGRDLALAAGRKHLHHGDLAPRHQKPAPTTRPPP